MDAPHQLEEWLDFPGPYYPVSDSKESETKDVLYLPTPYTWLRGAKVLSEVPMNTDRSDRSKRVVLLHSKLCVKI